ncbi:hypothetical protein LXL04_033634 [Taraxacum kok-saghyz]
MLILPSDMGFTGGNRVPNRPAEMLKNLSIYICTYYLTGIIDRSLTRVHIHVVTKIEGNTSGDTAAPTSSQLRRSDRCGI